MTIPPEYAIPYWSSIGFSILVMALAHLSPRSSRVIYAVMFLAASGVNARLAVLSPEVYLDYAPLALMDIYRQFILGVFAAHTAAFVLSIAVGQLACGVLMLTRFAKVGYIGASVFLLAIAPLGVGSAFPFSLFAVIGLFLLFRHEAASPTRSQIMTHASSELH